MKILWISYMIFPDLANKLGETVPIGGGWMYGLAKDLTNSGIELTVATVRPKVKEFQGTINGIEYCLLEGKESILHYDSSLEEKWKTLIETIKPDVVHIHGTEYAPGLSLVKACPNTKFVVSIQGIIGVIAKYYNGQIPLTEIIKNVTFRDIVRLNSIWHAKRKFKKRGNKIEHKFLTLCNHFIGRTQWDHDHIITVNPKAQYHFCNESLRDYFYIAPKWNLNQAKKQTIFISQALYPIKGLHKVLEALDIVKRKYPNIKLRVAGMNITKTDTFYNRIRLDGYGKYIRTMLKKLNLQDQVIFTGPLNEEGMAKEYLNARMFISPSSIENSPNSLGEAQLLGVPCIASYVGGVPDMVNNKKTGLLYRFEEVEMLAQNIISILRDDILANTLSTGGMQVATERHDRINNCKNTIEIYQQIFEQD